jgi:hypothetical protein
VAKTPDGFVPLKSLKQPSPVDPRAALDEIRRIYFKTTKQTIEKDLVHAIELLKSLDSEEQREKASVFMEGIAQMRSEWGREKLRSGKVEQWRSKGKSEGTSKGISKGTGQGRGGVKRGRG